MADHILVVDDDPAFRRTIADILELEGFRVEAAANGQEALERVEREPPALILLDMRMPVMDGWGFARALRERELSPPIIIMTAAMDAGTWARQIGVAEWLGKPFELRDLLAKVERYRPA